MKLFFSISFLLTTAFYILPIKEILTAGNDICFSNIEKEDIYKKEKSKELFSFSIVYTVVKDAYSHSLPFLSFYIPVILHTVETPPPDLT